jgi:hypothetical protein
MQVEILEHDVEKGTARIKFIHNNVTHVESYDLGLVVPGTRRTLQEQNVEFSLEMQAQIIDKLTAQVQREIEAGILTNRI